jgi:hypothetical protein
MKFLHIIFPPLFIGFALGTVFGMNRTSMMQSGTPICERPPEPFSANVTGGDLVLTSGLWAETPAILALQCNQGTWVCEERLTYGSNEMPGKNCWCVDTGRGDTGLYQVDGQFCWAHDGIDVWCTGWMGEAPLHISGGIGTRVIAP